MTETVSREQMLAPCPFCGGEASIAVGESNFNDAYVFCKSCNGSGPIFDNDPESGGHSTDPEREAREHWNARYSQDGQADVRQDGVRNAIEYIEMADNRLDCADCAECVAIAKSYLKEAAAALASQAPSEASGGVERKALEQVAQRANEGLGDICSLQETIHAMHAIARNALASTLPSASQASCPPPGSNEEQARNDIEFRKRLYAENQEMRKALALADKMISDHIEKFHDFDYQPHQVPQELADLRAIEHHLMGSLILDEDIAALSREEQQP